MRLSPPQPYVQQVEDVKLTEQHIKFGEVEFPPRVSSLCRSFIQQVGVAVCKAQLHSRPGTPHWHYHTTCLTRPDTACFPVPLPIGSDQAAREPAFGSAAVPAPLGPWPLPAPVSAAAAAAALGSSRGSSGGGSSRVGADT